MRHQFVFFLVLSWVVVAPPAGGQNDGDVIAYLALISTPTGGFVPLPTGAQLSPPRSAISFRYGHFSFGGDDAIHSLGITAHFRAGDGLLGLTGGTRIRGGGTPPILLGLDWTVALSRTAFSDATLVVALTPAVGAGILTSENANGAFLSGSLGASFTLLAGGSGTVQLMPYVTPAIGVGTVTADADIAGVRPMLGGGIAFVFASGVGVSAGFQKVFIDGGDSVIGLAVSFGSPNR